MSIHRESETTWLHTFCAGDDNDDHDLEATKDGLNIYYDTLPWDELDQARAIATKTPTIERLMLLLAHAVNEADGWHDDSLGGPIQDDALMEEARIIVRPNVPHEGPGTVPLDAVVGRRPAVHELTGAIPG